MAGRGVLRDAGELISPALAETVAAIGPPEADAALVRLTAVVASSIDHMAPAVRDVMLGQTAPLLLKLLQELDKRAMRRQQPGKGGPSGLQRLPEAPASMTEKARRPSIPHPRPT